MKIKVTVAAIALIASSNAFAFSRPSNDSAATQKVCFKVRTVQSGVKKLMYADCDETKNNQRAHLENLENGCPAGQVALTVGLDAGISSCLPPGSAQL